VPHYLVTVTGRFGVEDFSEHGEEFRHRFMERGAYESEVATERHPMLWKPVTGDFEAESVAAAAETELRAYESDAEAAGLGKLVACRVDVETMDGRSRPMAIPPMPSPPPSPLDG